MKHTMFHVPIFCYRFINWSDKFKKEILSQLELSPLKKNNRIQTDYDDKFFGVSVDLGSFTYRIKK